jgi:transcriptional regulator with XRE-family HTH domain
MNYDNSPNLKEEIAKSIKRMRGKIKQKDFAEILGIHKNLLNRYEKGKTFPRDENLKKITDYGLTQKDNPFGWLISGGRIMETRENAVGEPLIEFDFSSDSTKKLLDNVKEILDSNNQTMVNALKSNIKAFLEAVRTSKNKNCDKEEAGGPDEKS